MRTRAGHRKDSNHDEVVDWFRAHGCSVHSTHMVGDGFLDIVVGLRGINCLVEIKDGRKPPSRRQLTADEHKFFQSWGGMALVVESTDDCQVVLDMLNHNADILEAVS